MAGPDSIAGGNHRWCYPMKCELSVEISIKEEGHMCCSEASDGLKVELNLFNKLPPAIQYITATSDLI